MKLIKKFEILAKTQFLKKTKIKKRHGFSNKSDNLQIYFKISIYTTAL